MTAQTHVENFETFFHHYQSQVIGYLWRMTDNEQLVLDLCQETFFRAWQHFEQIREYPQPGSWLLRVATNLALQDIRRRSSPVGAAKPFENEIDPAVSDPGRRFAESELVRQTLLALSPKQRALLVLREVYGLPFEEVGAILGMSVSATRMALSRAREQFRQTYRRKDSERDA
jgi:RNA polymerase sigma-70 factor, ECF subfamily